MKRNILTIQDKNSLSDDDLLLFEPYQNIIQNFYKLATEKTAHKMDFIAQEFNGIHNADENIKDYYESLLGVTSYFQASKGGRGKYIEKKLVSVAEYCCLDNKLSELPKLILHTSLLRQRKLFGKKSLTIEQKKDLLLCEWSFIGDSKIDDGTTDLCSFFEEHHSISFLELKNRIDSGGVSARREIYDTKFRKIISHFIGSKPLFKLQEKEYNLLDFYKYFGIKKINLALGILFDTTGELATLDSDKHLSTGFYSSSKTHLKELYNYIKANPIFCIEKYNEDKLFLSLKIGSDFVVEIKSIYGAEISNYLFHEKINLQELIRHQYDDIWLFQLLAIDERHNLLKYKENITLKLKKLKTSSIDFRKILSGFISNPNNIGEIIIFLDNLQIDNKLIPHSRNKNDYLMDVLYFMISGDDEV